MFSVPPSAPALNGLLAIDFADALGNFLRQMQFGCGQDDDEFLAAHAAGHVDVPDILADARGQFLQHLVAHVMAVGVIHRLEEIHVDGQRRKRLAAIDGMFNQMAEMGFHVAPVVKAGERVGHRHFNGCLHADAQLLGIAGAPDLRVHPGHQLLPVDGADEIIVHAHVEGPHQALLVVGRHHNEDGNLPGLLQRFQLRAQAQAIELLGIQIDDDQLIGCGAFGNRRE